MRVLVVNNMAPFTWGGAEELARNLASAIIESGHQAEVFRIPFQWEPPSRILTQMLLVRGLELENVDRVIALKFPAYLIRHPEKTLWLLHQFRQAYDLLEAGRANLDGDRGGGAMIRSAIQTADDEAFRESRRIFVNSEITRDRLARFSGYRAGVLRPPLNDRELFTGGKPEGYVFAGGRVNAMKRQHLLIEALAYTPPLVRLVIAGPPDSPADGDRLRELVEANGLADRVHLDLRLLSRREIATYVNRSSAVACLPYDEDSLSYVAMEGAAAAKPILTTTDSGGVVTLVGHQESGCQVSPTPSAIAEGLTFLLSDARKAEDLGLTAREQLNTIVPSWPAVVDRLLR